MSFRICLNQWVSDQFCPILYSPVVGQGKPKWRPAISME
nr:MAG TPA: hypothetical protein [Caudoviricetes sp.]